MTVPTISQPIAPAPTSPAGASRAQLEKVATDFEAMALAELLAPMFEALDTEGLGGGGMGEQMFRPMLVQNYAQGLAANGGVGISQAVLGALMQLQGDTNGVAR
jgi:Rod binding domain-containing protein